jgi:putative transcriptional regulator
MARKSLEDVLRDPPRLSPEERERLDSMTDDEVRAAALSDPDAQPWTDEQLDEAVRRREERESMAALVRRAREKSGLSQATFAARFRIDPLRLKDWEQGRRLPDALALAYLRIIEHAPDLVEKVLTSPEAA